MNKTKIKKTSSLLEMKDIHIQGYSDEKWHDIILGVDISLKRGEVLGLIGESGAGKSTLGLAAMGFARPGCKIIKGKIIFDGICYKRSIKWFYSDKNLSILWWT